MKKIYLFILPILLLSLLSSFAQTTETFETETNNATSFSDNNQSFTIATITPNQTFDINGAYPNTGWNGTSADNRYVDNSGTAYYETVQFSISTTDKTIFKLKSMYLFLSQTDLSSGTGNCTIEGKLNGNTVFTAVSANDFNSSASNVNNGFSLFNLANYGGTDNTEKVIDEFVITTSGTFEYVALDALKWQNVQTISTVGSLKAFATCAGTPSASQSFEVGGKFLTKDITVTAPTGFELSTTGTGFSSSLTLKQTSGTVSNTTVYVRLTNAATGTPSGDIVCTSEGAFNKSIGAIGTVNLLPTAFQVSGNGGYCANESGIEVTLSGSQTGVSYQLKKSTTSIGTAKDGTNNSLSFGLIKGTGTYTIEATNKTTSCVAPMLGSAVITEYALPTFSSSQVNIVCKGDSSGKAIVTPLTEKAPFTYAWSPKGGTDSIASNLKVGGIYCTLTDNNGCKAIAQFGISEPANYLTGDTTAKACDKFVWKGKTYTESGNYTKTIQSKLGCDSIVTLHLTINPKDTTYEEVSGCNEVEYNNVTYTSNTAVTFTGVNKFGCDSLHIVEIIVKQFKPNTTVSIVGNTLISNQPSAGLIYYWKNCSSGTYLNANGIVGDSSIKVTQDGSYKVYIQEYKKGGCVDSSACVPFVVTGLPHTSLSNIDVTLAPNPSNGEFTLLTQNLINVSYKIVNTLGIEVNQGVVVSDNTSIDISAQPAGIYLLQLNIENKIQTIKIVKN